MKNKRIIIADICSINNKGCSSGHYFAVAQNYIQMFESSSIVNVAGGPIYRTKFKENHIALPFDCLDNDATFVKKVKELLNCFSLFRKSKGDIIVMQCVAQITTYIAILLFYRKKSNLFLIQYYTQSINSKWKNVLWKFIKSKVDGIICSSDRVGQAFEIPYIVVTDYIKTDCSKRKIIPYHERKYDFCLIGGIYQDKGQVEALKAIMGKGFSVVIAGNTKDVEIKTKLEEIHSSDPSINMQLGYISDDDYHYYLKNSKYCILNYRGTYNDRSSGVVLDAIFDGTPIIGHKCNALDLIDKFGLGYTYEDISDLDYKQSLDAELYDRFQNNIEAYIKYQYNQIASLKLFLNHGSN